MAVSRGGGGVKIGRFQAGDVAKIHVQGLSMLRHKGTEIRRGQVNLCTILWTVLSGICSWSAMTFDTILLRS